VIQASAPWAEKIHYVGHSMGTTGFMVMMNERPEYADKIIMANFLAPVAYVENMKSPIRLLAPFTDSIEVCSNQQKISLAFYVC
jgi:lysosomal acid lipase/cholesteryl ester hydrolase